MLMVNQLSINTIQPTVEMSGYEFDISYDLSESLVLAISL